MATPQSAEQAAIWYGSLVDFSGTVATGGTSQQVIASNPARKYLYVQNPNSATEVLFVNFTAAASTSDGKSYELSAGTAMIWDTMGFLTREALNVTAATNGHAFICKEG